MGHVRVLLQVLKDELIFSRYSKYEFLFRTVAFLCHIISCLGVVVYSKKTEMVMN